MSKSIRYVVSKDGKTVTAGGKTYSISAFKSQFGNVKSPYPGDKLSSQQVGVAEPTGKKVVTPKVDSSPEAAKKRAEKKAQKAGLKMLNKAGLGQKLTEPKPMPPKTGKTRIGGLGTGRGAVSGLGGGGLMDVNR